MSDYDRLIWLKGDKFKENAAKECLIDYNYDVNICELEHDKTLPEIENIGKVYELYYDGYETEEIYYIYVDNDGEILDIEIN